VVWNYNKCLCLKIQQLFSKSRTILTDTIFSRCLYDFLFLPQILDPNRSCPEEELLVFNISSRCETKCARGRFLPCTFTVSIHKHLVVPYARYTACAVKPQNLHCHYRVILTPINAIAGRKRKARATRWLSTGATAHLQWIWVTSVKFQKSLRSMSQASTSEVPLQRQCECVPLTFGNISEFQRINGFRLHALHTSR
jgi:hypothetical protein